jgi:hypothetical protein
MCLKQAGMVNVPEVGILECMTGMPFGTLFMKLDTPLFFTSHANINPHIGLSRALSILQWSCTLWQDDNAESALDALNEALGKGPVLLGPLDLGLLPYDPHHESKSGGDHFIVLLKLEGNLVQVHDPQSYPFAVLPLDDLMRAWYAGNLGYAENAYSMRFGFQEVQEASISEMLKDTLASAVELIHATPSGPIFYGGSAALRMAADVVRSGPSEAFRGMLVYAAFPLGSRRCLDAARFLSKVEQWDAAKCMGEKAELFGRAQYYATTGDWKRTANFFERLADLEDSLAGSI